MIDAELYPNYTNASKINPAVLRLRDPKNKDKDGLYDAGSRKSEI